MKNLILYFFAALGVIFFLLLIFLAYLIVADPYNLKPLLFPNSPAMTIENTEEMRDESEEVVEEDVIQVEAETKATTEPKPAAERTPFTLSAEQKQALLNLGISPESIPDSISVEEEWCFVSVLGEARVNEIKLGSVPTPIEFLRAKACI